MCQCMGCSLSVCLYHLDKLSPVVTENSQLDFVLFQSASTMREAIVREWLSLTVDEKAELRLYLLHYLTSHLSLVGYVQRQLLYTLALLVKRATLEPGFTELFTSIMDSVSQLLATGDVKMVRNQGGYMSGVDIYIIPQWTPANSSFCPFYHFSIFGSCAPKMEGPSQSHFLYCYLPLFFFVLFYMYDIFLCSDIYDIV